mmetsp:Transcript_12691/g.29804  ORF Transcript_12691/g.29804 Transcript_12691/m.29804 type:complete len:311 (+) Transcript_12691:93-1025(+)
MGNNSSTCSESACISCKVRQEVIVARNPLKLGATIPDFELTTTQGNFTLHCWLQGDGSTPWNLLVTHPRDFTPVCTTELGKCERLHANLQKHRAKIIGLSCDTVEDHIEWSKDVLSRVGREERAESRGHKKPSLAEMGEALSFPIIADPQRKIVRALGMLDADEVDAAGDPLPARCLVVLFGTKVKLTLTYPATTGRNFDEVLRVLTSLQLTHNQGLATPADWTYGERVMVAPFQSSDDARQRFEDFQVEHVPSAKAYLRSVRCPPTGQPTTCRSSLERVTILGPPMSPQLPSSDSVTSTWSGASSEVKL